VGVAAVVWGFAARPPALEVEVVTPLQTAGNMVSRIGLRVRNLAGRRIEPRVAVQSTALQPFFWNIDEGPRTLEPGEIASYRVSTDVPFALFDLRHGARVTVSDATSYHLRATTEVTGEPEYVYPDLVPNGAFRYWEGSRPTFWGVVRERAETATISP